MDYSYSYSSSGLSAAAVIIWLVFSIAIWFGVSWLMYWKVFEKAGKPGWAGIVPVYQFYVLVEIIGRPIWWFWVIVGCYIAMFIPILNFIAWIPVFVMMLLIALDVARCFGKGNGFGIGLWLLGIIFYPILGFGEARYLGPLAAGTAPSGQPMPPPPAPPMGGTYAAPAAPLGQPAPLSPPPPVSTPTPPPAQAPGPTPPPAQAPTPAPPAEAATPAPPAEAPAPTPPPAEPAAPATPESPTPPPPPPVS